MVTLDEDGERAPAQGPTEAVVNVHIGRLDIRAVPPAGAPRRSDRSAAAKAGPTLDEYLRGRRGGGR